MNKRLSEFLFLAGFLVLLQALEIGVFSDFPKFFAPISFLPVFVTYFSLTRNWFTGTILCIAFSVFSSLASATPALMLVSGSVVAFFLSKSIVSAFTLENKKNFSYLCVLSVISLKLWIFTVSSSVGMPVAITWNYVFHFILNPALTYFIGWLMFPLLIKWDDFFGHETDDARELKPGL